MSMKHGIDVGTENVIETAAQVHHMLSLGSTG